MNPLFATVSLHLLHAFCAAHTMYKLTPCTSTHTHTLSLRCSHHVQAHTHSCFPHLPPPTPVEAPNTPAVPVALLAMAPPAAMSDAASRSHWGVLLLSEAWICVCIRASVSLGVEGGGLCVCLVQLIDGLRTLSAAMSTAVPERSLGGVAGVGSMQK